MTICIAAFTPSDEIVSISDNMLSMSGGTFSTDSATLKELHIHPGWLLMFAADDVGIVPRLVRRIRDAVGELVAGNFDRPVDDLAMNRILTNTFQTERLARAEELYLAPNGVSLAEFNKSASKIFGTTGAAILRERLEQHRLGCELLVAGHCPRANSGHIGAHLLHVCDPGIVKDHDRTRYWAIGSGAYSALSALAMRQHNVVKELAETIYNVCEAKFAAESALGVGRSTFMLIHNSERLWSPRTGELVDAMRSQWELVGKPRPAEEAVKIADDWLKSMKWFDPLDTSSDGSTVK